MKVTLKDYIENYLMEDISYALKRERREECTHNSVVVRVYWASLSRIDELRLKISASDFELIPWKYYDNHPDGGPKEISDEEALDLIRNTLKAKYRIEKKDKSRFEIFELEED